MHAFLSSMVPQLGNYGSVVSGQTYEPVSRKGVTMTTEQFERFTAKLRLAKEFLVDAEQLIFESMSDYQATFEILIFTVESEQSLVAAINYAEMNRERMISSA